MASSEWQQSTEVEEKGFSTIDVEPLQSADAFLGSHHDVVDMRRLGKKQELTRNFRFISILGFTSCLMCTWEALLSVAYYGLLNGGTAGFIYTFIFSVFGMIVVVASMADMASMAPTTGGQYHWVSEFAPPSCQKFLSYMVGWLCSLGWQSATASAALICGTMIQGLVVLSHPNYQPTRWQGSLFLIAISLLGTFLNTYGAKHLPKVQVVMLAVHLLGFLGIFIPLWVRAPKLDAQTVFTSFYNGGGWPNIGVACLVGQMAPILSLIGADCAVHMAEEVKDASKILPRTMIFGAVFNSTLGFAMVLIFCFCITDLQAALTSPTGYPVIYVFYNATQSKGSAIAMSCLLILILCCASAAILTTASRQTFAFARDHGLPYSKTFATINNKVGLEIPLNAVLLSLLFTVILAGINIGSSAAFSSSVSIFISSLFTSYFISIGCVLIKRLRSQPLPPSRWSMGKFAIPVNILSLVYIAFVFVMTSFPVTTPVTPTTMNWAVLIWGAIMIIALANYVLYGRKMYEGPVVYVKKDF